eukprot:TRINITY_DN65192_c0_g1_i1.p1 TRINITY_DN65192_c0_g1~~TRINITY_DN65192_c0_g1_i1.p1  ORF type:complete len:235 (+),score=60.20 TRINITY_DN65192_c0_g1_i1:113-817(+)
MGGADDANPINRSLPAEVVSRKPKAEKKSQQEEPALVLDQRAVLAMRPEQRMKWLALALENLVNGKVQATGIYDILIHNKFTKGVSDKVGIRLYRAVCSHMSLFSSKQQRFLESESKLAKLFKDKDELKGSSGELKGSSDVSSKPKQQDLQSLVAKMLTLTATEGEKFMETLDSTTKDALEEFLEARMLAQSSTGNSEAAKEIQQKRKGRSESSGSSRSSGRRSRSRSSRRDQD